MQVITLVFRFCINIFVRVLTWLIFSLFTTFSRLIVPITLMMICSAFIYVLVAVSFMLLITLFCWIRFLAKILMSRIAFFIGSTIAKIIIGFASLCLFPRSVLILLCGLFLFPGSILICHCLLLHINPHKFISLLRLNYFLDMTPQSVNNPNHFQHYSLSLLAWLPSILLNCMNSAC